MAFRKQAQRRAFVLGLGRCAVVALSCLSWNRNWSSAVLVPGYPGYSPRAVVSDVWKDLTGESVSSQDFQTLRDRFVEIVDFVGKPPPIQHHVRKQLIAACSTALGSDIVLHDIGSIKHGTFSAGASDWDILVSRDPSTKRSHVGFTESDRKRVVAEIRKLPFVRNPRLGPVAIKFSIPGISFPQGLTQLKVDLVLRRDEPERFPKLRGGPDFRKNAGIIGSFFNAVPAAKLATIFIKSKPFGVCIKGLLLEAIVWRTAQLYSFPTATIPNDHEESFALALLVLRELQHWRTSKAFGAALVSDMEHLPTHKKEKYSKHFDKTAGRVRMLAWPVLLKPELYERPAWGRRLRQYGRLLKIF